MTYRIVISRTARPQLANELPVGVVDVVFAFMEGELAQNPRRVGKPLVGELSGQWSARRGAYRVVYNVVDDEQIVQILKIGHRADVYRP